MKIAVICARGIGDAMMMRIVSHNLYLAGHQVMTVSPHCFGRWFPKDSLPSLADADAYFLQHDNSEQARELSLKKGNVYTFYGSHSEKKHGPLKKGLDYVCNQKLTMVENVLIALKTLFSLNPVKENGLKVPDQLFHRKHANRVAIHTTSTDPFKNWPLKKFERLSEELRNEGYNPTLIPLFPTLDELFCFIYESGFFVGNDSGPGHIASYLKIPHLIFGPSRSHMNFWRPGWGYGQVLTPSPWPEWKWIKNHWQAFISVKRAVRTFYAIK